jgi:hypothetical protein
MTVLSAFSRCSPLLVGLERRIDNVAEGAGRRRGKAGVGRGPLPAAENHADGALGEGEDLRGQMLAEVGGFTKVHLELRHQVLDVAQLRRHQPAASIAVNAAVLHLSLASPMDELIFEAKEKHRSEWCCCRTGGREERVFVA